MIKANEVETLIAITICDSHPRSPHGAIVPCPIFSGSLPFLCLLPLLFFSFICALSISTASLALINPACGWWATDAITVFCSSNSWALSMTGARARPRSLIAAGNCSNSCTRRSVCDIDWSDPPCLVIARYSATRGFMHHQRITATEHDQVAKRTEVLVGKCVACTEDYIISTAIIRTTV